MLLFESNSLSSPAKAGDPVLRGISRRTERPRRTGYPAFAGYDDLRGMGMLRNSAVRDPGNLVVRPSRGVGPPTTRTGVQAHGARFRRGGRDPAWRKNIPRARAGIF